MITTPHTSRKPIVVAIVTIIILVVLTGGMYLAYQLGRNVQKTQDDEEASMNATTNETSNTVANSVTPTNSADNSEDTVDTSTWLTYSDSTRTLPLTFKYPTDWNVESLAVIEPSVGATGIRPKTMKEDYLILIDKILPTFESFDTSVSKFKTSVSANSKDISETKTTKFGKNNVTKISFTNKVSGYHNSEYFLTVGDRTYQISGESNDPLNATANDILATLRFN
jgi:hypothetical protein